MKNINVAVTGAAGQIGYSLLFRMASGQMFGVDTQINLSLIEVPQVIDALQGVVMELRDCAFPLLTKITATSDLNQGFKDADWALLVGSVPRKAGMERGDLLEINGGIFIEQAKALDQNAHDGCKVLVIGNPCNTNAYIAKETCGRIPKRNFFALTMLDQNRAAAQLALKAGVGVSAVSNIAIWGNHSATQYPDFEHALINGAPVAEIINDKAWLKTAFLEAVQQRGAEIIKARGKSSAASAANAVVDTVKHLTSPTPNGTFFSVAVVSDGSYGIDPGLIFGFPVVSDGKEWQIVQGLSFSAFAQEKIRATAEELLKEKEIVEKVFAL